MRVFLTGLLLLQAALPARAEYTLTIDVRNLEARGTVYLALYDDAEDWMRSPARRAMAPVSDASQLEFVFEDIEAGTYAVALYHDLDGNGELDTGTFGIPTEPIGFSNDARGQFGPPGFDACGFLVAGDARIAITVGRVRRDQSAARMFSASPCCRYSSASPVRPVSFGMLPSSMTISRRPGMVEGLLRWDANRFTEHSDDLPTRF